MNTLIISGGNINSDFALAFMKQHPADYIIAVDRGLSFVYQHQIRPDYILGDFDSVPEGILEHYRDQNTIPMGIYDPVKDATDTQLALEKAMEAGSRCIRVLGATGTRVDHLLGNIYALKPALEAGVEAYLVDEHNCISLIAGSCMLKRTEQYGTYISLLPLGDRVEGLTLTGFRYPLTNHTMKNDSALGVSNEIVDEEAVISMKKGILILIQSRD